MKLSQHALLSTLMLAAMPSSAQDAIRRNHGEVATLGFGYSVASAGDVDRDGVQDYWAGSPDPTDGAYDLYTPSAELRSGKYGNVLLVARGEVRGSRFGWALASGQDLDGDGASDVAIGAPRGLGVEPGAGFVTVRLGLPGRPAWPAPEAVELYVLRGDATGDRFGETLALVADRNEDGVAELVVGVPGDDVGGEDSGSVRIYSGADGGLLTTLRGQPGSQFGEALVNAGDLDGDGHDELLVGAPHGAPNGAGTATLLGGRTLERRFEWSGEWRLAHFGFGLATIGDVDADGMADIAVSAPGEGRVRAYSGSSGRLLWAWSTGNYRSNEPALEAGFGTSLVGVGDQNGDGCPDLAIGYPSNSTVYLHSGADGSRLETVSSGERLAWIQFDIVSEGVGFGQALACVPDQNGDGRRDVLVGAPYDLYEGGVDIGSVCAVGLAPNRDWVRDVRAIAAAGDLDGDGLSDLAYGSRDGVRLVAGNDRGTFQFLQGAPSRVLASAGDVDGDGVPDLLTGDPMDAERTGRVELRSGADGSVLHALFGTQPGERFGQALASVGDLDGDSAPDFAVGAPASDHPSAMRGGCLTRHGSVRIYSGRTGVLLRQITGSGSLCNSDAPIQVFGFSLAGTGDWNLDGVPDLAVGAPGSSNQVLSGNVFVYSGADGSVLQELSGYAEFGIALDGGPDFDLDADGRPDLLIGVQDVEYGTAHGGALVYSSATGDYLRGFGATSVAGYGNSVGPGYAVAALADFDGDGYSDVAVGNPAVSGLLGPGVGEVLVYSGRTGRRLTRIDGTSSWDYIGYSLVSAGDVDGDGSSDLLSLGLPTFAPSAGSRALVVHGKTSDRLSPRLRNGARATGSGNRR